MRHALSALAAAVILLSVPAAASSATGTSRYLAPASVCGDPSVGEPVAVQLRAMRCYVAYARKREGAAPLATNEHLERSARRKARDIRDCSFSHTACGRSFTHWIRSFGYTSAGSFRVGENLAWGSADRARARSILSSWLRSPAHRRSLLDKGFRHHGIGVVRGTRDGLPALFWTHHFGQRR